MVDDHVDIAKELQLDGVHLGKNDMHPDEAREILGGDFIIGATANTFDDVQALRHLDIDYIGLGPLRFTATKQKLSPVLGLDGYRDIIARMKDASINLPVVAIGGITEENIMELSGSGIAGAAVVSAIFARDDVAAAAAGLRALTEKMLGNE